MPSTSTTSTAPVPVATTTQAAPTDAAVPTDTAKVYKETIVQWSNILAMSIKYCQLATGEQAWTNPAMSLHDFLLGGGWHTPSDVCNAYVSNIDSMVPPFGSLDRLPAVQVTPGWSNVNPSPHTPYARMTKAKDMLATWARQETAAAHGCDFGQCPRPDQATRDLLSQAKAIIAEVCKQTGITLDPDTLLTPGTQSLPVSS